MASVDVPICRVRGRGRGVLALTSFDPLPRPSKVLHMKNDSSNGKVEQHLTPSKDIRSSVTVQRIGYPATGSEGFKCMAKYNFTGNPNQPGGFVELDITQGEFLTLLQKGHAATKNHLWWEVRNSYGTIGFVPANYCMLIDAQPAALPWLENKRLEEEKICAEEEKKRQENGSIFGASTPTQKAVVKEYQSAYAENKAHSGVSNKKQYYCEICVKQLNGPTPYNMHMASKAHREEEEYLKSCAS